MRIASFNELAQGVLLSDIYVYIPPPATSRSHTVILMRFCKLVSACQLQEQTCQHQF